MHWGSGQPDKSARSERIHRSGSGRRAWPGICRRSRRGSPAGGAVPESARTIGKLIADIQKDTEESVGIMAEVLLNAENGVRASQQTSDKFAQILDGTQNMTPHIEEVTAVVQQMTASIEEVSASAMEIAGIAQTQASSSQQVAASTEEQLASMEQIHVSAVHLSEMAVQLKQLIRRFIV